MRYLGVDPGARRVGLAVGDDTTGVATPLEVIRYEGLRRAAAAIARKASHVDAGVVVVGQPTNADGELTPACARSQALVRELEALGVRVALQSEFLTSDEARRRARAGGLPPTAPVDHIAAQVLLEEYLCVVRSSP